MAGLGDSATFACTNPSSVSVEWLLNETSLTSLQLDDVIQAFGVVGNVRIGSLQFRNIPMEYNNTRIQCIVNTTSQGVILSPNATLVVQGLPSLQQHFKSIT